MPPIASRRGPQRTGRSWGQAQAQRLDLDGARDGRLPRVRADVERHGHSRDRRPSAQAPCAASSRASPPSSPPSAPRHGRPNLPAAWHGGRLSQPLRPPPARRGRRPRSGDRRRASAAPPAAAAALWLPAMRRREATALRPLATPAPGGRDAPHPANEAGRPVGPTAVRGRGGRGEGGAVRVLQRPRRMRWRSGGRAARGPPRRGWWGAGGGRRGRRGRRPPLFKQCAGVTPRAGGARTGRRAGRRGGVRPVAGAPAVARGGSPVGRGAGARRKKTGHQKWST